MSNLASNLVSQRSHGQKVDKLAAILLVIGSHYMHLLLSLKQSRDCITQSVVVGIGSLEYRGVLADDFALGEAAEVLPSLVTTNHVELACGLRDYNSSRVSISLLDVRGKCLS